MKLRYVARHAGTGAWSVRRRWDTRAATAVLAAITFACVVSAGVGTAIEEVVERELDRARPELGTLVVERRSSGSGRMDEVRRIVEELRDAAPDSPIEAVSVLYRNPLAAAFGLLPVGRDGKPHHEVRGGIAVRSDDPFVMPGFGLPADAAPPFERGPGTCWRFAFVVSVEGLTELTQATRAQAREFARGPPDELPLIAFEPMFWVTGSRDGKHAPPKFHARPEAILERWGEHVPKVILDRDAALVLELARRQWTLPALTQMQNGARPPCGTDGPTQPLVAWTVRQDPEDLERRLVEIDDGTSFAVAVNHNRMVEVRQRDPHERAHPPIARLLAWVRDYRNREAFARAETTLTRALENLKWVEVKVRQRDLLESHRNVHGLSVTRQRIAIVVAGVLILLVTGSFGLGHVYRARREIGLLLSQGASKGAVLSIHVLETLFVSGAGAASGTVVGVAAVHAGVAVPAARWMGLHPDLIDALSVHDPGPVAAMAITGVMTAALAGGLVAGAAAASVDPAQQVRTLD